MALGDGTGWDETTPTDATFAIQIDDYMRDMRKGTRARMANEHTWPTSQSATSEAGKHKFLTLQMQATAPTLAGTQVSAVFMGSQATTGDVLYYVNAATQNISLSKKMYYWYLEGALDGGAKQGVVFSILSDGKIRNARAYAKTPATSNCAQFDILYNGVSIWTATADQLILAVGDTSTSVTSFVTTNIVEGGTLWIDIDKTGTAGSVTVMLEVW